MTSNSRPDAGAMPSSCSPIPASVRGTNRRRVLKGVLGALPAVYTLPSGAQTALVSAACNTKPGSLLQSQNLATAQTSLQTQVQSSDLAYIRNNQSQELMLDPTTGRRIFCIPQDTTLPVFDYNPCTRWVYEDGTPVQRSAINQRYGTSYIDSQGQVRTFSGPQSLTAEQEAALNGVTMSCWASLNPTSALG